ncbi:conserved hypothetical protein [Agrobacterium deltaense Zutra 3/1]|uniref:Uncharacterized protein n=1 Tax=Agrobacterium deltaense Zutra 3/1 TaxID=1183427 RepID=A0A1S7RX61_9HYPH|nr:conserved hypothetical protein [Agrobacterium deltaense Zutra 3/1]
MHTRLPFAYLLRKLNRTETDQPVRFFLNQSVMLSGFHIASPPQLRARPLPRSAWPILADTPAGPGACCFCPQRN